MLQALWERAMENDEIESPAWHGEVLAARVAGVESGKAKFISLSELKDRLGR